MRARAAFINDAERTPLNMVTVDKVFAGYNIPVL
jgi:hypothetical protein